MGYLIYQHEQGKPTQNSITSSPFSGSVRPRTIDVARNVSAPARFSCDGRVHCSQMTSCEEAQFFLKNCPGTKMDGDSDGIPCERQLC
ncbi:MAG: excalibur calcium-binding domain-containing protein [Acidovorax sp.]|nr:MAG: excalibur calcium-binding domain-containing protein [Acidovorax sp.]